MRGRSIPRVLWLAPLSLFLVAGSARADVLGQVWYGGGLGCLTLSGGSNPSCYAGNLPAGTLTGAESAEFIAPDVNFYNNGPSYTVGAFAGNPAFFNQSAGFNPAAGLNNTYWEFSGYVWLDAGADTFSVTHDDGVSIAIDGTNYMNQQGCCGPTSFTVTNAGSAGWHSFDLQYDECCGGPAYVDWTYTSGTLNGKVVGDGSPSPVPEPGNLQTFSALLGLGLVCHAKRRSNRTGPSQQAGGPPQS